MGIPLENEELVTPRDFRREFPELLERLKAGKLNKLVLMKGSRMEAVVLTIDEYERLHEAKEAT